MKVQNILAVVYMYILCVHGAKRIRNVVGGRKLIVVICYKKYYLQGDNLGVNNKETKDEIKTLIRKRRSEKFRFKIS